VQHFLDGQGDRTSDARQTVQAFVALALGQFGQLLGVAGDGLRGARLLSYSPAAPRAAQRRTRTRRSNP
jgi:hypothetical protein